MLSEGDAVKNGESTVGFFLTTMLQHTGQFWLRIFFIAKNNITTLENPPYHSDLAPADFYLFARLKSALKGRCCCDATDIIKNATKELKRAFLHNGLQECFQRLCISWQKCIVAQ
jgi:transposase